MYHVCTIINKHVNKIVYGQASTFERTYTYQRSSIYLTLHDVLIGTRTWHSLLNAF